MDKEAARSKLIKELQLLLYGKKPSLAKHLATGSALGGSGGAAVGWGLKDLVTTSRKGILGGTIRTPRTGPGPLVDPIEKALVQSITGASRGALIGGGVGAGVGGLKYLKAMKPYEARKNAVNLILAGLGGGALAAVANKGKKKTASVFPYIGLSHTPTLRILTRELRKQREGGKRLLQMAKENPDAATIAVLAPGGTVLGPAYLALKRKLLARFSSEGKMRKAISELKSKTGRFAPSGK